MWSSIFKQVIGIWNRDFFIFFQLLYFFFKTFIKLKISSTFWNRSSCILLNDWSPSAAINLTSYSKISEEKVRNIDSNDNKLEENSSDLLITILIHKKTNILVNTIIYKKLFQSLHIFLDQNVTIFLENFVVVLHNMYPPLIVMI